MNKAYIIHYAGYDYGDTGNPDDDFLIYELPDHIHFCYENAVKEFEEMIAEELENWDLDCAQINRDKDNFYIKGEHPKRWTGIQIKCLTIKE